jgi:hypothetical protein
MTPVSPVVPGSGPVETRFAENQPQYQPLPAFRSEKAILSRWRLTEEERKHIADGGDLFICQLPFDNPLQPILPIAAAPERALEIMFEVESTV